MTTSLRHEKTRISHTVHYDPLHGERMIAVHTGVMDRGYSGSAIVSANDGTAEVVTVITPDRLRGNSPRHIARQVKFIAPSWSEGIYRRIWDHRDSGDVLAFSTPVTKAEVHAPGSVLHDYERVLIRGMAAWLEEVDSERSKTDCTRDLLQRKRAVFRGGGTGSRSHLVAANSSLGDLAWGAPGECAGAEGEAYVY